MYILSVLFFNGFLHSAGIVFPILPAPRSGQRAGARPRSGAGREGTHPRPLGHQSGRLYLSISLILFFSQYHKIAFSLLSLHVIILQRDTFFLIFVVNEGEFNDLLFCFCFSCRFGFSLFHLFTIMENGETHLFIEF